IAKPEGSATVWAAKGNPVGTCSDTGTRFGFAVVWSLLTKVEDGVPIGGLGVARVTWQPARSRHTPTRRAAARRSIALILNVVPRGWHRNYAATGRATSVRLGHQSHWLTAGSRRHTKAAAPSAAATSSRTSSRSKRGIRRFGACCGRDHLGGPFFWS